MKKSQGKVASSSPGINCNPTKQWHAHAAMYSHTQAHMHASLHGSSAAALQSLGTLAFPVARRGSRMPAAVALVPTAYCNDDVVRQQWVIRPDLMEHQLFYLSNFQK